MNVLLVHGLGRTPLSMAPLARSLQQAGHATELFGYAAFAESYDRIARRLRLRLTNLAGTGDYAVVAHSLGGLLTRSALEGGAIALPKQVIMLGTPNQSPRMARIAWKWLLPFRWFARDCGKNLADRAWYATLPEPNFPYQAIAGTRGLSGIWSPFAGKPNDGLVALEEVVIAQGDRPIQIPTIHTLMMNHPAVKQTVVNLLRNSH